MILVDVLLFKDPDPFFPDPGGRKFRILWIRIRNTDSPPGVGG